MAADSHEKAKICRAAARRSLDSPTIRAFEEAANWFERDQPSAEEEVRLGAADVLVGLQKDLLMKAATETDAVARETLLAASELIHDRFEEWRPEQWGEEATAAGFPPVPKNPHPEDADPAWLTGDLPPAFNLVREDGRVFEQVDPAPVKPPMAIKSDDRIVWADLSLATRFAISLALIAFVGSVLALAATVELSK